MGYEVTIMNPPAVASESAKEMAMIWINGAQCDPKAYVTLATEFQAQAAAKGYKIWVGIPHFYIADIPSPVEINAAIGAAEDQLKSAGWSSAELYISAHSLGTVFTQDHVLKNSDKFAGQILMGGGLLRTHRSNNNDTGLTHFDYPVPTLTISGTKDGLYRVTRAAEGYFHQFLNIEKS